MLIWPANTVTTTNRHDFLDMSGLFCLVCRDEPHHRQAVEAYQSNRDRLTQDLVLAEFVSLANTRKMPRQDALDLVSRVATSSDVEVVWTDRELFFEALDLLHARRDKSYSLCDAMSFVIMRERGLTDALSTDRHFEQEGFRRLLVYVIPAA